MNRIQKWVSIAVASVSIVSLAVTCAASPSINTPLYTYRMEQVSSGMSFLPTERNGFTYTTEKGYTVAYNLTGKCNSLGISPYRADAYLRGTLIVLTCKGTCGFTCRRTCLVFTCNDTCWDTCQFLSCGGTCESTCLFTCESTCPNTCAFTCGGTCPFTCESTCPLTCWNMCERTWDGTCDTCMAFACEGASIAFTCDYTCMDTCQFLSCGGTCEDTCFLYTCEWFTCSWC